MAVTIASPSPGDRAEWEQHYIGYRAHYGRQTDAAAAQAVWSWISTPGAPLEGRVAHAPDGRVVGIIHFRDVPRPLNGCLGGYIDDIFVDSEFRGAGVADALVEAVATIGRTRGWADIRWVTSDDNYRARGFYDRIATRTMMLTYEFRL